MIFKKILCEGFEKMYWETIRISIIKIHLAEFVCMILLPYIFIE